MGRNLRFISVGGLFVRYAEFFFVPQIHVFPCPVNMKINVVRPSQAILISNY